MGSNTGKPLMTDIDIHTFQMRCVCRKNFRGIIAVNTG